MAKWPTEPTWTPPSTLNKGNEYASQDGVTITDMNAIIKNLIYLHKYGGTTREDLNAELSEQETLIAELKEKLANASAGGGESEPDTRFKQLVEGTITEVSDDTVTSIGQYAFTGCSQLTSIDLPSVTSVGNYAFQSCSKLSCVIIRAETVCTLANTNAFNFTPFASGEAGGTLLVPRALVESYKTATNWSVIWGYGHNRFLALEDYTVDGTITGEIDWDKLNGGAA